METDGVAALRYVSGMVRKSAKRARKTVGSKIRKLRPSNQWVRDALSHWKRGQAELAREMKQRGFLTFDRSTVYKIVTSGIRDVGADEAAVIAQITGFPQPDSRAPIEVPLLSWIPAGRMSRDNLSDEKLRDLAVAGLPDGDWIALIVDGDSMDRISPPESIILVDRSDKTLVPNACYVIADLDGNSTYKRFRPGPNRFEPVSNNMDLEPIYVDEEPVIIGRVRRTVLDL